eukprot:TRINITY_DN76502_c0_g1_i1.p1 TRINITY_DN76502_c0_g1~~TRINITY_DN76502_c0_g1_i1.p1  ORF type:complete len:470 (+),score=85.92 TRINITY_DN76502_c0_g1_i1:36-1412(+)
MANKHKRPHGGRSRRPSHHHHGAGPPRHSQACMSACAIFAAAAASAIAGSRSLEFVPGLPAMMRCCRPFSKTRTSLAVTRTDDGIPDIEPFDPEEWGGEMPGMRIPKDFDSWTDYTRYALERVKVHGPLGPDPDRVKQKSYRPQSLVDRKRALGIDFGPSYTGLALSLGGVNTMPMGTLRTGEDWKQLAITIAQIASTRRVKEIVIGQPLEKDGTEGRIGKLVRYFSQLLADATLLLLGTQVTVYLWDERYSTLYAAVRLSSKPKFDGAPFKSWLDGQRGLSYGTKSLLDAEAARAILEHWLTKDSRSEVINKELSERVSPSREACVKFLKYRKVRGKLKQPVMQPTEPAGEGKAGWEWFDQNPEAYDTDEEGVTRSFQAFRDMMDGMDSFGNLTYETQKRLQAKQKRQAMNKRIKKAKESEDDIQSKAFEAVARSGGKAKSPIPGMDLGKERWSKYR